MLTADALADAINDEVVRIYKRTGGHRGVRDKMLVTLTPEARRSVLSSMPMRDFCCHPHNPGTRIVGVELRVCPFQVKPFEIWVSSSEM